MTETQRSPVVGKRRLIAALRRAREEAGFTQEQVATEMEWSLSKLIRIERGTVRIAITDLRILLQHYRIAEPERVQQFIEWARASRARPWWSQYRERLPSTAFEALLGLESDAAQIGIFNCTTIPGILQTEEYAKGLLANYKAVYLPPDDADARLEVRLRRLQAVLARSPTLDIVIDEAVLRRRCGEPEAMRDQLAHLLEVGAQPGVSIFVVPFAAGPYVTSGSFTILSFDDDDDSDVVYVELFDTDTLLEHPHDVALYQRLFQFTRAKALDPARSAELIRKTADEPPDSSAGTPRG